MPWVIYDPYFQTLWIKKAEQMGTKKRARTSILGCQVFRLRSLGSFELFRIILSRSGPRRGHFSDIERGSSTYKVRPRYEFTTFVNLKCHSLQE